MSPFEIIIIAAAGFFLLWLWRGGAQPRPVPVAAAAGTRSCHAARRPLGCLGGLVLFLLAGLATWVAIESGETAISVVAAVVAGLLLLRLVMRSRGLLLAASLVFLILGGLAAGSLFVVYQVFDEFDEQETDWLDGPAGEWSPFVEHRAMRAREIALRQERAARKLRERVTSRNREFEFRFSPTPQNYERFIAKSEPGSTLKLQLRPAASQGSVVTPEVLSATLLTMMQMLTSPDPQMQASAADLTTLNELDVHLRSGGVKPLKEFVLLDRRSKLNDPAKQVTRIEIVPRSKAKKDEERLLDDLLGVLSSVREQWKSSGLTYDVALHERALVILLDGPGAEGLPVEQDLAVAALAAKPAAPAAVALPPSPPAILAPLATHAPQADVARVEVDTKPTQSSTWSDSELAYHLTMYALPESLGGAAKWSAPAPDSESPASPLEIAAVKEPVKSVAVDVVVDAPKIDFELPADLAGGSAPAVVAVETTSENRPAWMDWKPTRLDDQGVYYLRRSTGRLYDTPQESHEAIGELVQEMTREYVQGALGREAAAQVRIPIRTVLHEFTQATWDERGPVPGLPDDEAWETHVLLRFDRQDRELVEDAWRQSLVAHNLRYTGAATGLVLALLGTVFGYLKLDTATRGFYSGRLKVAAGAVLAAITTLGILLAAGTFSL